MADFRQGDQVSPLAQGGDVQHAASLIDQVDYFQWNYPLARYLESN
jgi:hypothetical protein